MIAAASSAALMAPALPIASVPTGIPAGIWTIDRRLSMPLSALLSIGTPSTGNDCLEAAFLGAMGVIIETLGGAMRRDDARFMDHTKGVERFSSMAHGF